MFKYRSCSPEVRFAALFRSIVRSSRGVVGGVHVGLETRVGDAAVQQVVARPAVEPVVARAAPERVVSAEAEQTSFPPRPSITLGDWLPLTWSLAAVPMRLSALRVVPSPGAPSLGARPPA